MKIGRKGLIFLLAVIILAGAVTLFMLYRGQMKEQDRLNTELEGKNTSIQLLTIRQHSLEADIAALEADIAAARGETGQLEAEITQKQAELGRLEDERAQAVADALTLMQATGAKFLSSAESIEYNDILFGFALGNNIVIQDITTGEPSAQEVDGIEYITTPISLTLSGGSGGILGFVETIVNDEAFKTAIIESFDMSLPAPLSAYDIEVLKDSIRKDLMGQAMAGITTEQMIGFITEAIAEVAGPGYPEYDNQIDTQTLAEIAAAIKANLDSMVELGYIDPLSADLAALIEEHIAGPLVDGIISPLADEIAALIVSEGDDGPSDADIIALVGEDIAKLLGDNIAGSLSGDIAGLLKGYISTLIQAKMAASVADAVEAQVQPLADLQIAAQEQPSSQISLVIYTYKGG